MSARAWSLLLLLSFIWGSSFYFLKIAAQDIGIIPTAWFRVAIASIFYF